MNGYVKTDERNRVLEWSPEQWIVGPDTVEVSNCEIFDELCVNGLDDFKIESGIAIFDPKPETQRIVDTGLRPDDILQIILDSVEVEKKPAEKIGFITVPHYLNQSNSIVWTFEPDPNYTADEDGSYLKPFTWYDGLAVQSGMFYTDGEDIWEAIRDGVPQSFSDSEYFDII